MKTNHVYHGSCLDVLSTFEDESIECVITSPPYWQLRDYGWNGQWGLEPTFQMYLENMWSMMDEIHRVLKKEGTVWINLGDTYGTKSGGMACSQENFNSKESKYRAFEKQIQQPKTIHKSLLLIPHRFALGCIDRGFLIRNDIIWAKRNGMPESVADRFSKKHEFMFFMTKSTKYYFDLDSIRDKYVDMNQVPRNKGAENYSKQSVGFSEGSRNWWSKGGKNPGDVSDFWDIPTKPSSKGHYASYNFDLINKPIIAGCPEDGIILDPFCGTATTGVRALQLNRKFIGIEGNEEYVNIANKQLDVERNQTKLDL